eukprot:1157794-Pelagomonas_calceolata.AAC.1
MGCGSGSRGRRGDRGLQGLNDPEGDRVGASSLGPHEVVPKEVVPERIPHTLGPVIRLEQVLQNDLELTVRMVAAPSTRQTRPLGEYKLLAERGGGSLAEEKG